MRKRDDNEPKNDDKQRRRNTEQHNTTQHAGCVNFSQAANSNRNSGKTSDRRGSTWITTRGQGLSGRSQGWDWTDNQSTWCVFLWSPCPPSFQAALPGAAAGLSRMGGEDAAAAACGKKLAAHFTLHSSLVSRCCCLATLWKKIIIKNTPWFFFFFFFLSCNENAARRLLAAACARKKGAGLITRHQLSPSYILIGPSVTH